MARLWLPAAAAAGLFGCQAQPKPQAAPPQAAAPVVKVEPAVALVPAAPTAPADQIPPGVDARRIARRAPADMASAHMTLADALTSLPTPGFLAPPLPAPGAGEGDVLVAAQRAYAQGRQALSEGQNATDPLQNALSLAPDNPQIMRLLSTAYLRIGNQPRAAYYLEQVLRHDPGDAETTLALAEFAMADGSYKQAAYLFNHAVHILQSRGKASPNLTRFLQSALAGALDQAGYDQAAIDEYTACISGGQPNPQEARNQVEFQLATNLARSFGAIWEAIGDANLRLGRLPDALAAYDKAVVLGIGDVPGWIARYTYAHIQLGHPESAEPRVSNYFKRFPLDAGNLNLLRYMVAHGVAGAELTAKVQQAYYDYGKPANLAIALADLLGPDRGAEFLAGHLHAKPADRVVFEHLIKLLFAPGAPGNPGATPGTAGPDHRASAAITAVADAIDATPGSANEYALMLLRAAPDADTVADAFPRLPSAQLKRAAVRYLQGMTYLQMLRYDDARASFEALLADQPGFTAARLQLVSLLLDSDELPLAAKALQPLVDRTDLKDPQIADLNVQVLVATGHNDQALQYVTDRLALDPSNATLTVDLAGLLLRTGRAQEAETKLLDLINANPTAEAAYQLLLAIYRSGQVPEADVRKDQLVNRLKNNMPAGRLTQLELAIADREQGRVDRAAARLRGLLDKDPHDLEVLTTLALILYQANPAEADAMIKARLDEAPKDRALLEAAADYYRETGNSEHSFELREQLFLLIPPSAQRATRLAALYMEWPKYEKAAQVAGEAIDKTPGQDPARLVELQVSALLALHRAPDARAALTHAIAKFPPAEAALTFQLAMVESQLHNDKVSEQLLERNYQKFPNDAATANGLGYVWADRGVRLPEAQRMIQMAVDAEPGNAAYLDSLGWVYYKLGQFDQAVTWLEKARTLRGGSNPVILNHLGDATYRTGNIPEAVRIWQQSQQVMESVPNTDIDPELEALPAILRKKLDAASRNEAAPVADIPQPVSPR